MRSVPRGGASPTEFIYTRGARTWHVRLSNDGVDIDCPKGAADHYDAADVAPECRYFGPGGFRSDLFHCATGTCP